MTPETALALCVAVPLAGAVGIALCGRAPNLREGITLATGVALFAMVASLHPEVREGRAPRVVLAEMLPGLSLALQPDALGLLYALLASGLWILNSVYSIGYMRGNREGHQTRFFVCFAVAIASAVGIAFSANLLTLFVFYEVLTLSTFPLVTHKGTPEARRSGRIYLGILLATSTCMLLLAILWTWSLTGDLDFRRGGILEGKAPPAVIGALFVLFVLGTGKAALMPFHFWLPAAMVAPTPVSAFLHAVAVVKAGVFIVLKVVVSVVGPDVIARHHLNGWLLWMAGGTIVVASLVALTRDNLKARLAYSTVGQLAYVTLGAGLANEAGILGGSLHMVMHGVGKITLFFCAGAIYVATHRTKVSELDGLGRRMPVTMAAFLIASLSIIGLPPLGGAWSKWYLALGTLEGDRAALLVVLLVSSLLNVAYLLPIPVRAFFRAPEGGEAGEGIREAPAACVVPLALTALGCLALFLYPDPIYELAVLVAGP